MRLFQDLLLVTALGLWVWILSVLKPSNPDELAAMLIATAGTALVLGFWFNLRHSSEDSASPTDNKEWIKGPPVFDPMIEGALVEIILTEEAYREKYRYVSRELRAHLWSSKLKQVGGCGIRIEFDEVAYWRRVPENQA